MSDEELINRAVDIINEELLNSPYEDIRATRDYFHLQRRKNGSIELEIVPTLREPNFIQAILDRISKDRRRDTTPIYHYIPLKYGLQALTEYRLRAYQMKKYVGEDPNEYKVAIENLHLPEETEIDGEKYGLQIDTVRSQSFILCFSTDPQNMEFWKRSNEHNPYLCFEVIPAMQPDEFGRRLYEHREIFYDHEPTFSFLLNIAERIKKECGVKMSLSAVPQYAMYSKDGKFMPEKEVRFAVNGLYTWHSYKISHYSGLIGINHDADEGFFAENSTGYEYLALRLSGMRPEPFRFFDDNLAQFKLKRVLVDQYSESSQELRRVLDERYGTTEIVRYETIASLP